MRIASGMVAAVALIGLARAGWAAAPAEAYCDFALRQCDRVVAQLPEYTRVAEAVALRHLQGGALGFVVVNDGTLAEELTGRAGGMINMGFGREWKKDRTVAEKSNDVALISWQKAPAASEPAKLQDLKKKGMFIVGFGPRDLPGLAEEVKLCDAFFDTGVGPDDRAVALPDGTRAGFGLHLANALDGWVFVAELVGALTRQGKMPVMYKSYFCEDGAAWAAPYIHQKQFHDDYTIAAVPAGELGRAYVDALRGYIATFRQTQLPVVGKAVDLICDQVKDGQPLIVLPIGHMTGTYVGRFEDARWAKNVPFEYIGHTNLFLAAKPQGQLALRVGYFGEAPDLKEFLRDKHMRLIYISSGNPRAGYEIPEDRLLNIDTGMPFGDACVSIKGYPIKVFAPSGVMQIVAYEAVNTEVLARLAAKK